MKETWAQPQVENKKEIWNSEIQELKVPIQKILEKLGPKIENGEYKYIVGDDASGRIPALIFFDFIKKVSTDNNLPIPELYFLAGAGRNSHKILQLIVKIEILM